MKKVMTVGSRSLKFEIILNQQTPIVKEIVKIEDSRSFIEDFCSFANTIYNCAGLAANQVAHNGDRINIRFFTILTSDRKMYPIINPEIIETYGSISIIHEGCKTWLNKTIIAERYPRIRVRYSSFDGIHEEELVGVTAQIFQHELNHLDGVEEKFYRNYNIGRNELCLCKSSKKYKKCCGR